MKLTDEERKDITADINRYANYISFDGKIAEYGDVVIDVEGMNSPCFPNIMKRMIDESYNAGKSRGIAYNRFKIRQHLGLEF